MINKQIKIHIFIIKPNRYKSGEKKQHQNRSGRIAKNAKDIHGDIGYNEDRDKEYQP